MQSTSPHRLKGFGYMLAFGTFLLLIFYYKETAINMGMAVYYAPDYNAQTVNRSNYLVYGDNCVIPHVSAFNQDVKKFYKPSKYFSCTKLELLTYISKSNNGSVQLNIDEDIIKSYTSTNITCCYSYVRRNSSGNYPDDKLSYSECKDFQRNVILNETMVLVKCKNERNKEIYKNTHAFTTLQQVKEKIDNLSVHENEQPFKILFIGIDSVSRLNLRRAMPLTQKYLEEKKWIEYQGYNKIGDNTFPNLMAIFTGYNNTWAYKTCDPKILGKMDKCDLIWYDYDKRGFITAYGEDTTHISSFNYKKKGFRKQPTDFYFRPYMKASEDISTVSKYGMIYCAGPETSGERILNLIKDFSSTFRNYSTFGVFWMNSFSHNNNNNPSMMDAKVQQFFKDLEDDGVFESNIVIFLSDHGLRFGDFRNTKTGWYEERLPFLQFWIPQWFRDKYPTMYENLKLNYDKLTTPYDLYMTLQHLLKIHDNNYTITKSNGCPNCHSLFEVVSNSRSCEDVSIDPHYCTCTSYTPISKQSKISVEATEHVLNELRHIINKSKDAKNCATYRLKDVLSSSLSNNREKFNKSNAKYMLLVIRTIPEAVFEATVSLINNTDNTITYNLNGDISRLDSYAIHSKCIEDYNLKKYCHCIKTKG